MFRLRLNTDVSQAFSVTYDDDSNTLERPRIAIKDRICASYS